MSEPLQLWLIRHGETQWSASGAHTSYSDIPLTPRGEKSAAAVGSWLAGKPFSLVLVSPRQRALETSRIAGYGALALVDHDLSEWNYGEFEGRTTADIRSEKPGWSIWTEGPTSGETVEQVGARAIRVIERAEAVGGCVGLFSHAHFLRILAATWVGLPPRAGSLFALSTSSVSVLAFERETRVIQMWNRSFEEDHPPLQ
ncbi:histidine phosphatase family protein [Acidicapsa dinghuensis]|uniref:Histidine phosphatase family protein n=1 Tax=Acidicapsa dinghuensis TaxID=2218256 RepID=A0ABW1EDS2_9BACT|nr:histidine phosphatase family protein [Acidicapsa dinghuensis]